MPNIRFHRSVIPAAAAAVLLVASASAALAQNVGAVSVTGRAPTTLRLSIHGLDAHAIAEAVHTAAGVVCRNAIDNREVSIGDFTECRDASADKAMRHYATLVRRRAFAAHDGAMVLSAR